jgi:hypothetical protein
MLILPSGGRNGDALRRDARVQALLLLVNECHGRVVVTDNRSHLAHDVGRLLSARPSYLRSEEEGLEEFVTTLTTQVGFAS